jgi:hypothetical protein
VREGEGGREREREEGGRKGSVRVGRGKERKGGGRKGSVHVGGCEDALSTITRACKN